MTEANHTPGPWHISGSVFVGDSPFPAVLDHLGLVVCDVLDDGKSEPETLANAKLIAAAPDMDKALKQAWGALAWIINYDSEDHVIRRAMETIEATRKAAGTYDYDAMRASVEAMRPDPGTPR